MAPSKQSINSAEEIQFENKFIRTHCSFIIAIEKKYLLLISQQKRSPKNNSLCFWR